MSLDPDLLAILCCPETKQEVSLADATLIQKVNAAIGQGHVRNKGNQLLVGQIEGAWYGKIARFCIRSASGFP